MAQVCLNCPLRLFNEKGHYIRGVGNKNNNRLIVVNSVDYDAYKKQSMAFSTAVNIINDIIFSSTGEHVLDSCYITPFIKCNVSITKNLKITNDIANRCKHNLIMEYYEVKPKKVLFLGSVKDYLDISINNSEWMLFNNVLTMCSYNPYIKLYNPDKFEVFKEDLIKWFNHIIL